VTPHAHGVGLHLRFPVARGRRHLVGSRVTSHSLYTPSSGKPPKHFLVARPEVLANLAVCSLSMGLVTLLKGTFLPGWVWALASETQLV